MICKTFPLENNLLPYSRKILRAKIFEVDLPQNSSRIKFRGSTRLSLHLYAIIRFSRINFQGSSEIHKNSKIYCPRKIPAIRYTISVCSYFMELCVLRVYLCMYTHIYGLYCTCMYVQYSVCTLGMFNVLHHCRHVLKDWRMSGWRSLIRY